jgi:perosamine synthetase
MRHHPPAETKIPLYAFWGAIAPQSRSFKSALCSYLGVDGCALGNSGRALLFSLLSYLKKEDNPGRTEVLIPGYTCYSVAASVAKAGLAIRPYDLDPHTLAPDMNSLTQRASNSTLAIVLQHIFGIPTPVNDIRTMAEATGAILIEDAAQALGGSLDGSLLGTGGDFGLYSFGRGKPLPLGSGGALIGRKEKLLQAIRIEQKASGFFQYLAGAAAQLLSEPRLYWIAEALPLGLGETVFDLEFDVASMERMTERLGEKSLESLTGLNAHRARIAGIYRESFSEELTVPLPLKAKPVYTRFPLLAGPGPISEDLRSLGVRRMYPKAIADEKAIRPFLADQQTITPGASQIARSLITLPTHKGIRQELACEIAERVKRRYK